MLSGCQPFRHSSMNDEFCVQRLSDMVMSPVTQILQPMHSRISSMRPSSIFSGRNGSAIDGLAAPMKSMSPCFTCRTIMSALVKRPTPTTGFGVNCLRPRIRSSCAPSAVKREVPEQASQVPCAKSQMSGNSACMAINSRNCVLEKPCSPANSSSDSLTAMAQVSPTSSLASEINSFSSRERFSSEPPYSSVRLFVRGLRKCWMMPNPCAP